MTAAPRSVGAVILDWAGTMIDHGSRAPAGAFVRAFATFGVAITEAQARGPMGRAKRDHIRAVAALPDVAAAWRARHGREPDEADGDAILAAFEPMTVAAAADHTALIPGALATVEALRARGVRIGSTTGYTRPIMQVVLPLAAAAGYAPEVTVCAGDLAEGRPSPLMMWYAMARLGVWPADRVVKVDDTPIGLAEGGAAGTWTVGVALTGNIAALSAEELATLTPEARAALRARAMVELHAAGADLVIDSVAALPDAVAEIDRRLVAGARPRGAGG